MRTAAQRLAQKKYYNSHKELVYERGWKYNLRRCYGITHEYYYNMLDKQGGVCKICFKTCKQSKRLSVDHCHKTGNIRGLLCQKCNRAIGILGENYDVFLRGILYLSKSNAGFIPEDEDYPF